MEVLPLSELQPATGQRRFLGQAGPRHSAPLKGFQTTCAETKRTPCSPMSPAQTPARRRPARR